MAEMVVDNVLPTANEYRSIKRRWRNAKGLVYHAQQVVRDVSRMAGVPEETRLELLQQMVFMGQVICNLWWMSPSRARPLQKELDQVLECELMVNSNVEDLNSVIGPYHPTLDLLVVGGGQ